MAKKKRRQNNVKIKAPRLKIKAPHLKVGKFFSNVEKRIENEERMIGKSLRRPKHVAKPIHAKMPKLKAQLHTKKTTSGFSRFISGIEKKIGNEEETIMKSFSHKKPKKEIHKVKTMRKVHHTSTARNGITSFFSNFGKKIGNEEHAFQNSLKHSMHKNGKTSASNGNVPSSNGESSLHLEKTNGHAMDNEMPSNMENPVIIGTGSSSRISAKVPVLPKVNGKNLAMLHDGNVKTGVPGFDSLFAKGIPKGSSVLIAGGPGTGKTIFCLQTLYNAATRGEKCLYMSFEENEEKLRQHMRDFGWDPAPLEKKGLLMIRRFDPFDITRSVEALLTRAKKELLIDIQPVFFPENPRQFLRRTVYILAFWRKP